MIRRQSTNSCVCRWIEPGESDCREEWADVRNENEESIKEVDKEL